MLLFTVSFQSSFPQVPFQSFYPNFFLSSFVERFASVLSWGVLRGLVSREYFDMSMELCVWETLFPHKKYADCGNTILCLLRITGPIKALMIQNGGMFRVQWGLWWCAAMALGCNIYDLIVSMAFMEFGDFFPEKSHLQ